MVYILTLPGSELDGNQSEFLTEERLTKAFPKSALTGRRSGSAIVLVLSNGDGEGEKGVRHLRWMGVRARLGIAGRVDATITVDPLKPCLMQIPIDGQSGLASELSPDLRDEFRLASANIPVGICGQAVWDALEQVLRRKYPRMAGVIDWLVLQATPPVFNEQDAADRFWQERWDGGKFLSRASGFPARILTAWRRPRDRNESFLAGVVPKPLERDLKSHDIRNLDIAFDMPEDRGQGRWSIHVLVDAFGRRLEVIDLNDGPVEGRTGTDVIYYHEPTQSFVLVQYKRLDQGKKLMYVDGRFYDQLDRLEKVTGMSKAAAAPSEWRLGGDSCFIKLAHYKETENANTELVPGMYLPISYLRLLLADDATRGTRAGSAARYIGYPTVERHLVNDQFVELVKHGLVGTVGVTREDLCQLVFDEVAAGMNVMVGIERSPETVRQRQARARRRGKPDRRYQHHVVR